MMKKQNLITIILGVLFVALVAAGIVLIVLDTQISHEVAAKAAEIQEQILADESKKEILEAEFQQYLNSKTPAQTGLTIGSIALIIGGITSFVFMVKRISKSNKENKEKEEYPNKIIYRYIRVSLFKYYFSRYSVKI